MPRSIISAESSGGSFLKSGANCVENLIYGVRKSLADFFGSNFDVFGETVKQVSALDIHGALAVVGVGGADFYFYILCGALAYKEVVLL